ncbi:alpha-mannosidase [Marinilabiliaceae bacterium JC017]|nr:alpha-mannosidase [Marinilabiliaceae bacterium JC017]
MKKMKTRRLGVIIGLFLCELTMLAQIAVNNQMAYELGINANQYTEGYKSDNGMGHFEYHSLLGATTPALLVRSTSEPIEWQSASIPKKITSPFIEFLWLASAEAGGRTPVFNLYIENLNRFTFSQGEATSWEKQGPDGAQLKYFHVKSDQHGDTHGYMYLRIPRKWVTPGVPVNLKIEGNGKGGTAWLMVYQIDNICQFLYEKASREGWLDLNLRSGQLTIQSSIKQANKNYQLVIGEEHYKGRLNKEGKSSIALTTANVRNMPWRIDLESALSVSGFNFTGKESFYCLNKNCTITDVNATGTDNNWSMKAQIIYQPELVKQVEKLAGSGISKGTICLMNSSHQDIAWMDDVEKCVVERDTMLISPMINDALTKESYSFDIEDALIIEEYINRHPDKKDDLMQLINDGKITVGGTYTQPYEEMYSGESLARQFYLGKKWLKKELNGYEADTYWNVDVPGRTLQMAQLMSKAGVDKLIISRHAKGVFNWASPDGSAVKTYSSDHYSLDYNGLNRDFYDAAAHIAQAALFWAKGYNDLDSAKAVMPIFSDWDMSPAKDYSELIEQWHRIKYYENEQGQLIQITLPQIKLTTTADFINKISANSSSLQTISGERPALWLYIHGPSHQKAVRASREADRMLINAEKFASFDALTRGSFSLYPEKTLSQAWKAKIYPDHGWGGKNGDITDAIFQAKYEHALAQAQKLTQVATTNIAGRVKTKGKGIPFVLFNGLNWERQSTATVTFKFDDQKMMGIVIRSSGKREVPFQYTSIKKYPSGFLKEITVEVMAQVPALGYSTYYVTSAQTSPKDNKLQSPQQLETDYYQIILANGGISSIIEKATGKELINSDNFLAGDVFTMRSEGNGAGEFVQVQQPSMEGFDKVSTHHPNWVPVADGPLFYELELRQPIRHAVVATSIKIYKHLPRIDFNASLLNWDGELYREFRIAFPLKEEFKQVAYEVPYGILRVGQDEMEGYAGGIAGGKSYNTPCKDIHPRGITNWIGAYNKDLAVVISSSVAAADYIDPINTKATTLQPILLASRHSCHWEGNPYPQTGDHHFAFSLTTTGAGLEEANRKGVEANEPLLVVVEPEQVVKAHLPERMSFLSVTDKDLIISAIKKAEDSDDLIIRCYNTSGKNKEVEINLFKPIKAMEQATLIEESLKPIPTEKGKVNVSVGKYGIETFKVNLDH